MASLLTVVPMSEGYTTSCDGRECPPPRPLSERCGGEQTPVSCLPALPPFVYRLLVTIGNVCVHTAECFVAEIVGTGILVIAVHRSELTAGYFVAGIFGTGIKVIATDVIADH